MGMLDDLKLLDDALEKELGSTENLPALDSVTVRYRALIDSLTNI